MPTILTYEVLTKCLSWTTDHFIPMELPQFSEQDECKN